MIDFRQVLLLFPIIIVNSTARIQFYIGCGSQVNTITHKIIYDNDYWNNTLSSVYSTSFKTMLNDAIAGAVAAVAPAAGRPTWLVYGTPSDLFSRLLNDQSSEFYKNQHFCYSVSITVGAFICRHKAVLLAIETYGHLSSIQDKSASTLCLVKGDVPEKVKTEYNATLGYVELFNKKTVTNAVYAQYNGMTLIEDDPSGATNRIISNIILNDLNQLNPIRNPLAPTAYIDCDINVKNTTEVQHNFDCGLLFRVGTILKDRVYVFTTLGTELRHITILANHRMDDFPSFTLFCCRNATATSKSLIFDRFTVNPYRDQQNESLSFNKNRTLIGFRAGCGTEFFVNQRFSVRSDIMYTHYANSRFASRNGNASIRYSLSQWDVGIGLFYRI
jgi:opacity protein-like surface antigen